MKSTQVPITLSLQGRLKAVHPLLTAADIVTWIAGAPAPERHILIPGLLLLQAVAGSCV